MHEEKGDVRKRGQLRSGCAWIHGRPGAGNARAAAEGGDRRRRGSERPETCSVRRYIEIDYRRSTVVRAEV